MDQEQHLTYADAGVDYAGGVDAFKVNCQNLAKQTAGNFVKQGFGIREIEWSRGESCYLMELPDGQIIGKVIEGLGTKAEITKVFMEKTPIAEAVTQLTGRGQFQNIGIDTVATIANDMITLGAHPASIGMHLVTGSGDWFKDGKRSADLTIGWHRGCERAMAVWSCGETAVHPNAGMDPDTCLLSGAAVGYAPNRGVLFNPSNIAEGDTIVLVESNGVQTNGLSLVRKIAGMFTGDPRDGFNLPIDDGRLFGEAVLDPSHIYVPLIHELKRHRVQVNYAVHISGHALMKLMRAPQPFSYVVEELLPPHPVFSFIQKHGKVEDREMYSTFNMGQGLALYVRPAHADTAISIARGGGLKAIKAGHIRHSHVKNVHILPKNLLYRGEELAIR